MNEKVTNVEQSNEELLEINFGHKINKNGKIHCPKHPNQKKSKFCAYCGYKRDGLSSSAKEKLPFLYWGQKIRYCYKCGKRIDGEIKSGWLIKNE